MNINLADAKTIVNRIIAGYNAKRGGERDLMLVENDTIEREYYWVFFYTSKRYLKTGNISFAVAGNSPIIIDKIFGEIYKTGTARPVKFYMDKFEETELPKIIERNIQE